MGYKNFNSAARWPRFEPYAYLLLLVLFVSLTHPMMRLGFDMWHHLGCIQDMAAGLATSHGGRTAWYGPWAWLARTLEIQDVFVLARVMHIVQSAVSLLLIYAGSAILLGLLTPTPVTTVRKWAFLASLIWLSIFATYSVGWHQVWLFWYSLTYQITLPLVYLLTALTARVIYRPETKGRGLWVALVALGCVYVLRAHAMELVYFGMALVAMGFTLADKIGRRFNLRTAVFAISFIFGVVFFVSKFYSDWLPEAFVMIKNHQYDDLYSKIQKYGIDNVNGLNRKAAMWNELIELSLFLWVPLLVVYGLSKAKNQVNGRFLAFLGISSLFIFIPNYTITAGLASVISDPRLVNRFYYASTVFLVIPAFGLMVESSWPRWRRSIVVAVALLLLATFFYSKYISESQNYYKNVYSIKRAFNVNKIGINYSPDTLDEVARRVEKMNAQYGKDAYLVYARQDYGYILRYVMRMPNALLWPAYRTDFDPQAYEKSLKAAADAQHKTLVLFSSDGLPADSLFIESFGVPMWP